MKKLLIIALVPALFGCASARSPWSSAGAATVVTAVTFPAAAPFVALAAGVTAASYAGRGMTSRHDVAWGSWLRHKYGAVMVQGQRLDGQDLNQLVRIAALYRVPREQRLEWAWVKYAEAQRDPVTGRVPSQGLEDRQAYARLAAGFGYEGVEAGTVAPPLEQVPTPQQVDEAVQRIAEHVVSRHPAGLSN